MKKVLIITYYWPPSGGAGVQRWLKLSKYLARKGVEVHVLSVDPSYASYMQLDESLMKDIDHRINVHLTQSFEPINIYAKIVGKSKVPIAGFSNVNNQNWKQKSINFFRSNCFIPDPRKGWVKYAYTKALEIIESNNIKYVITTSPPHSSQLIGLKLKNKLKSSIHWISDLRDPWTDIYYYKVLQHSFLSHRINKKYERDVLEKADLIFTVGERFKESFLTKSDKLDSDKIKVITNGYDPDDFWGKTKSKDASFIISYVGTISNHYKPEVFFLALNKLIAKHPDVAIQFKLVGVVSDQLKSFILDSIGNSAIFISTVSHDIAVDYMINSDVLLLITQGEEGTIPGKAFEYLASKNKILCIGGGDASRIVNLCEAGRSFERHEEEAVLLYLEACLQEFLTNTSTNVNDKEVMTFSREYQANQILDYCK